MFKFKNSLAVLIFILTSTVSAQNKDVFKIGAEMLIPFEFVQNGQSKGINIQLIDTIFKRMNIPYEIHFGTEEERAFDLLKHGKVDAILSISYKKDREDVLWYPADFENDDKPQNFMWASEYVFFGLKNNINGYSNKSLSELKKENVKVGVIHGVSYSPEFWAAKLNTIEAASDEDNYKKLVAGEIDLYLTDKTIGRFTLKSLNLSDKIGYLPQRILSKPYTLAISKLSKSKYIEAVKKQFYIELDWTKKSGVAKKVYIEYLQQ